MADRNQIANALSAFISSPGGEEFKGILELQINLWFQRLNDMRVHNPITVAEIHGGIQFAQEIYRKLFGEINFGRISREIEEKRANGFYNLELKRMNRAETQFDKAAI